MKKWMAIASLSFLLMAAACARDAATMAGSPGNEASPLFDGRTLISVAVTEDGAPKRLAGGTQVEVRLMGESRLVATAGCNTLSAAARLDDGRLVIADMEITDMGCTEELHEQDRWLAGFLQAGPAFQVTGDDMTLSATDIAMRLVREDATPQTEIITDVAWTVDTVLTGDTAASVPAGVTAYLTFAADETLVGFTGCNTLRGRAAITDDRIVVTDMTKTKKTCDAATAKWERTALQILSKPMTYRIEQSRLTLENADGSGLQLRR